MIIALILTKVFRIAGIGIPVSTCETALAQFAIRKLDS